MNTTETSTSPWRWGPGGASATILPSGSSVLRRRQRHPNRKGHGTGWDYLLQRQHVRPRLGDRVTSALCTPLSPHHIWLTWIYVGQPRLCAHLSLRTPPRGTPPRGCLGTKTGRLLGPQGNQVALKGLSTVVGGRNTLNRSHWPVGLTSLL